jgi:uncharacterized DUF497 family protein
VRRKFEWDENKAQSNLRKHSISFSRAIRVFSDPFQILEQDQHVDGEERWRTTGAIGDFTIVVVAHTIRDHEQGTEVIRIISARRAEPHERRRYDAG